MTLKEVLQLVGAVVAPLTLLTALMFYMGWARTSAVFDYFGVEVALLRFSNQDFVLRSVDSLWAPLVGLLVLSILALTAHRCIRSRLLDGRGHRPVATCSGVLAIAGLGAAITGGAEVVAPGWLPLPDVAYPLLLGVGVALAHYSIWLCHSLVAYRRNNQRPILRPPDIAITTLTCLLVVASLFWAAKEFATDIGQGLAATIAASLQTLPEVTVFSEKQLSLGLEVVAEDDLSTGPTPNLSARRYRYRYRGLRLFSVSGDRILLLPDNWYSGAGPAILLVLDSTVRIELQPEPALP